ncbi:MULTISPECIES: DUF2336 domain-containing protein [Brevundimonas]|jgi:uncharacterized protein (DUF2336 family)|uniref:Uncharacterized protein (DUF2336 family) n=1 Tax=Brevundimonas aurantiaca TaxID=74316 RepID=A0A7W9C739_9CAUL|nr:MULTISPECIES: DUF2336 domain-containing protein [Brevundimonas]MAL57326.1 hypothetical protein [Brevundimonas sp.]MBB1179742.1 hypothetical protein [Pseudomonas sp. FW305-3-2-15-E-TSA4]MBB5740340.1 uncharacterized protein (DUF2336 family) [Brevundimonas aurantiaca]QFU31192.1 hypothetical protein BSP_05910 [Brevundimonas sp. Bb-A]HAF80974.1 hypothetical protein [Brevundimonas sp.]
MSEALPPEDAEAIKASRLPQLIALAEEASSEKRRLLLRELTDQFFGDVEHSAAETDLYGAVLETLCEDMEVAVRAELAARFAVAPDAPHSLIKRLAHDAIEVAEPVLRGSTVLTDADLIGVVSKHGQDHLRAVSGRVEVPEAVSEIIVARGDDHTLGALLRNDGARLSRAASETAVERAKVNPALHAPAVERKGLPIDLLNEMYFVVEARLRHQILEQNASLDPALLEAALAAGRTRVATSDGALPPDYAESQAYVEELHAAGQLTPQVLIRFLRSKGRTPFLVALSRLADIDFHTARGIVDRRDLDALAVVCKAADIDRAIFLTYAVSLLGADSNPMGKAAAYGRMYGELTTEAAGRTLRFWRMRRVAQAA